VKTLKWCITLAAGFAVAGAGWLGLKQYRRHIDCKRRNAAFERRIDSIRRDARDRLKVGTPKDDVARFYRENEIPFSVHLFKEIGFEAIGTLYTSGGCAPLGCGTDDALIGVRVRVDADGTVTGDPEVVDLYTDCL
jgi:hypothetical protein